MIRESGGDRNSVTGGTRVLSDRIVVEITQRPGESFIDRMIALVEGASRQKTPNEIALNILLASLTIIFLLATVTLQPLAIFAKAGQPGLPDTAALDANGITGIVLVSLLVCLIPTTIGALLSAIGIAGMDRLVQRNVLAMSGRAVEAAGDVGTLLLDKTGTITLGNRQAARVRAGRQASRRRPLAEAAQLSSLADETPEGRSVVVLAKTEYGLRERALAHATFVPFTAQTRMSGVDLDGRRVRKGAAGSVLGLGARGRRRRARRRGDGRRRHLARAAAPRCSSPSASPPACRACSASSTSRTSSSTACASGSPSCGRWASAR